MPYSHSQNRAFAVTVAYPVRGLPVPFAIPAVRSRTFLHALQRLGPLEVIPRSPGPLGTLAPTPPPRGNLPGHPAASRYAVHLIPWSRIFLSSFTSDPDRLPIRLNCP